VIDGYEGAPIQDGVVLIAGERIVAVGPRSEVAVPPGTTVIDTEGMSVLPGLMDMHVHLMILGHADYEHWDKTYIARFRDEIMPIAAKQLLMSGITTVRDLGAPLEDSIAVKKKIERGEIPGPRLFVSGPLHPARALCRLREDVPMGRERRRRRAREDAAADRRRRGLHQADRPGPAHRRRGRGGSSQTAHKAGKAIVAHAHREDEIRMGLKHNVDCFEHTGLATEPGYPEDILAGLRKRNNTLYWCPTIEGLFLADYTARVFPERLDDPTWRKDIPKPIADDIRQSLRNVTSLDYFTLTFRRLPTLANKFKQLRDAGVTMLVGTDSGIPANFHTDSTWRELQTWVRLGMTPMQAIAGATRWPARFLKKEKELGTLMPGRYADVIAVRGDVLTNIELLQKVDVVVKNGQRVK
jgi:imidazolonepropionase-like amidohydrolase